MKIYHTETQADYDALMVELERQGCTWFSGLKPTEAATNWKLNSNETCVKVDKKVVMVIYEKKAITHGITHMFQSQNTRQRRTRK